MFTGTVLIKPLDCMVDRENEKEREIRPYRPSFMKSGQPATGIGEMAAKGHLLICEPGVGISIRYHQPPFSKSRPDHRCTMHRMICNEEERLGDRINLLGDRLPDDPADPCCTGLPCEDRIAICKLVFE